MRRVLLLTAALGLLLLGAAARPDGRQGSVAVDPAVLRSGDLVFRRGTSAESRVVLATDRRSEYSHVGIVYVSAEGPQVIHAAPAELEGGSDRVRMEPISEFLAERYATRARVMRVAPSVSPDVPLRAAERALAFAREGRRFDGSYDLATPERLYCTELVWLALKGAGLDLAEAGLDTVSTPFFRRAVLLPSTLLGSPHLTTVLLTRDTAEQP